MVQIRAQIAQAEEFVKQAQSPSSTKTRTGANPLMASIDQQLLTAQSELTPITSQIEGYNGRRSPNFDDQLKKLQDSELEVNNLTRQIESLTADMQALRTNLDQARLAENMDQAKVSSVSIIDAPRLEPRPVFPKKTLFGLAGVAIGLGDRGHDHADSSSFGNTIITVEGAERIFDVPVVAALPDLQALAGETEPRPRFSGFRNEARLELGWYLRRLRRMSIAEIAWRARTALIQQAWRFGAARGPAVGSIAWSGATLPALENVDHGAAAAA